MLDNITKTVKDLGMKQVALTDHGTMMGSLNFFKACKKEGLKPIIGVEAYITNDEDGIPKEERTRDNHHLVLVAKDNTGYQSLLNLVSRAQLQNFYFKPRISKSNLLIPGAIDGLVATSACLGNEVNRTGSWNEETKQYDNIPQMYKTAEFYQSIFGKNYYLEIQDNDDEAGQQKIYNEIVIKIANDLGLSNVITSDAHYTNVESSELHSMIMAMQFKKTLQAYQEAGEMKYGPWFFIRSPQQMLEAAQKYNCESAFWNACEIGNSCNVDIEMGKYKMPEFNVENEADYAEFLATRGEEDEH